jgi:hypothetical protein
MEDLVVAKVRAELVAVPMGIPSIHKAAKWQWAANTYPRIIHKLWNSSVAILELSLPRR